MTDDGHHYTFGAPSKGWPEFDETGKVKSPAEKARDRTTKMLGHIDDTLEQGASAD